ncbi:MAG TPA: biotin--[acetyl-CoA-carboxylase] ligase [Leucothrix sp.]|nr:biotin--[acetyl-CoA-carboxylase] ligase [Leucothrix sp.]
MNIDRIKQKTATKKISYFYSIDSTNSYLLEHGECGEICISDSQSAGRGRRGNTWVSPDTGNVYFSLCWCFDKIPEFWSLLGLVVGIAIAETLEDIGLKDHGIKWPNDIFWQQRKMGGILIETVNQTGKVVIGIGLNLKISKADQVQIDQDVISIEKAMQGKPFLRDDLIISLIGKLYYHLDEFTKLNINSFMNSWHHWDILYGETVSIIHQGNEFTGQVRGIDSQGRLGFVEDSREKEMFFSSADIKLKSLNKT